MTNVSVYSTAGLAYEGNYVYMFTLIEAKRDVQHFPFDQVDAVTNSLKTLTSYICKVQSML